MLGDRRALPKPASVLLSVAPHDLGKLRNSCVAQPLRLELCGGEVISATKEGDAVCCPL